MERVIARHIPLEVFIRYVEKLAEKTPPDLALETVKEVLERGLRTEFDLEVSGLKVRGSFLLKSPP